MRKFPEHGFHFFIPSLFFAGYALYVYFVINQSLYAQYQEPYFFLDSMFLLDHLKYPGGFLSLSASFLSQFYLFSWAGTLIITLIALLMTLVTKAVFDRIFNRQPPLVFYFVPALLLLALHQQYTHDITIDLGVLFSAFFFNLYLSLRPSRKILTWLLFLISGGLVYYLACGYFLIFASLCALYEILIQRQILMGLLFCVFAVLLPLLSKETWVLWDFRKACLFQLPFDQSYNLVITPYLLLFFFYVVLLVVFVAKKWTLKPSIQKWIGVPLVLVLGFLLLYFSQDRKTKVTLQIDQYARQHQWQDLIALSKKQQSDHILVSFLTHQALYHEGRLLDEMFSFPQNWWIGGLLLPTQVAYNMPLQNSTFWMACGHLNQAERWAHEALARHGETAWTLQALAEIYRLNHHPQAAEKCLNRLDQTLLFRGWASRFRNAQDIHAGQMDRGKSVTDFIVHPVYPESDLEHLVQNDPQNKMAFEYLMAHDLLTGSYEKLLPYVKTLRALNYPRIPRHFEEALIFDLATNRRKNADLCGYKLDSETVQQFHQFQQVVRRDQDDPTRLKENLGKQFSGTFWYYFLVENPLNHPPRRDVDATTSASDKM